ncbi:DNA-processing protein DprA [Kitasatospora sp. NPDC050463]|uniref:DNA-processing protein DprA n=1 Tax=Kitasatospora sp. NPDC050463 TaxID=3155786 RepID=UPI0033C694A8
MNQTMNRPQHPSEASQEAGPERRARAVLSRLSEPGDAVLGRWLTQLAATDVVRAIRDGSVPDHPGLDADRLAAYRARLVDVDPLADLERVRTAGGRFIIPGDTEWPSQLDDLGDGRPLGLWVAGTGSLRLLALRSVAVVGARACTAYGAHVAGELSAQLAERGWVVVSGAAHVLYPVTVVARPRCTARGRTRRGAMAGAPVRPGRVSWSVGRSPARSRGHGFVGPGAGGPGRPEVHDRPGGSA